MGRVFSKTVTIENGESLSDEVQLAGWRLIGVDVPEDFIGDGFSFQAALPGKPFRSVKSDAGDEIFVTAVADELVGIDTQRPELEVLRLATRLKLRAGSEGAPSVQDGDREITLILEE